MQRSLHARRGVVLPAICLVVLVGLAACGSVAPQKTDDGPCVIGTSRIDSCTLK